MFDYEINNGLVKPFTCSYIVEQEEAYLELAMQMRGSPLAEFPDTELIFFLKKKWTWLIKVSAMCSVFRSYKNEFSEDKDLQLVKKFLSSTNLLYEKEPSPESIWRKAADIIQENLIDIIGNSGIAALTY